MGIKYLVEILDKTNFFIQTTEPLDLLAVGSPMHVKLALYSHPE